MPTFRRVPPADFERYQRVLDYAFRPEAGPQDYDEGPPERLGERWGLYDDGLLTTCTLYEFEGRWRGAWTPLGGLAAVASPPEHRRQGLVREMIREALAEYRDRGVAWVALWPFEHDFYRRLGWAIANKFTVYECAPDALSRAAAEPAGRFERVTADDWERLRPVQLAHGEGVTLSRRRSEAWWRQKVFDSWEGQPYVYAWVDDSEALRAYVVYDIEKDGEERTLRVQEASATDEAARRQLLRFYRTHDSQVSTVKLYRAAESVLLDQVEDPRGVDCETRAGPMIRLGDVRAALSRLPVDSGVAAQVVLEVSDPLAEWNEGRFLLSAVDGAVDCAVTKRPPEAQVSVGTLSQLAIGYQDVATAREQGDLQCDEATARRLSRLFPEQTVCLREFF